LNYPQQTSNINTVMKIKDLINELSQYNQDIEVKFSSTVECFRTVSGCQLEGEVQISENDGYVEVEISGEETFCD
jgi:hypothetical protein